VSALRQEMQAKIQKELDEIAAATPSLLDNIERCCATVGDNTQLNFHYTYTHVSDNTHAVTHAQP
jgi:hypothetical protein